MWKNLSYQRYYWAGIGSEIKELIAELEKAEVEEDCDIFLLEMHLKKREELSVFDQHEQGEMGRLLSTLVKDSHRHLRTLKRVSRVLENYWQRMSAL